MPAFGASDDEVVPGEIVVRLHDPKAAGQPNPTRRARLSELKGAPSLMARHRRRNLRELEGALGAFSGRGRPSARLSARGGGRGRDHARADRARERLDRSFILRFDASSDLEAALQDYREDPNVETVSLHYVGRLL